MTSHHAIGAGRREAYGWRWRTSVSQSLGPTGHCVRCTFAEGALEIGTIGVFSRESGAPGRARTCDPRLRRPEVLLSGITRNKAEFFQITGVVFRAIPGWPPGRTGPPRRRAPARPTTGPRRAIPPPRPTPPPRRPPPPTPPRVASGAGCGPALGRGRAPGDGRASQDMQPIMAR